MIDKIEKQKLQKWIENYPRKSLNEFITKVILGNVGIKPERIWDDNQIERIYYSMMKLDNNVTDIFNKETKD